MTHVNYTLNFMADFWIQRLSFYDQLYVNYKYKGIFRFKGFRCVCVTRINVYMNIANDRFPLLCYSYESGTKVPLDIIYTTSPSTNQKLITNLRPIILQSAELDDDNDGRVDRFEFNIKVPVTPFEEIVDIDMLFNYDVRIDSNNVKYSFDAVSVISYTDSSDISSLWVEGDLNMQQTWPLSAIGG